MQPKVHEAAVLGKCQQDNFSGQVSNAPSYSFNYSSLLQLPRLRHPQRDQWGDCDGGPAPPLVHLVPDRRENDCDRHQPGFCKTEKPLVVNL